MWKRRHIMHSVLDPTCWHGHMGHAHGTVSLQTGYRPEPFWLVFSPAILEHIKISPFVILWSSESQNKDISYVNSHYCMWASQVMAFCELSFNVCIPSMGLEVHFKLDSGCLQPGQLMGVYQAMWGERVCKGSREWPERKTIMCKGRTEGTHISFTISKGVSGRGGGREQIWLGWCFLLGWVWFLCYRLVSLSLLQIFPLIILCITVFYISKCRMHGIFEA